MTTPVDGDGEANGADRQVGETVRVFRGAMSQKALADAMRARFGHPWSQSTVWSIETGARPLRLVEARDLADLLEVQLERLLDKPPSEQRRELFASLFEPARNLERADQAIAQAADRLAAKLERLPEPEEERERRRVDQARAAVDVARAMVRAAEQERAGRADG
ncbi:helix-turn-helix transcriptional regulator [Modestobacter sp. VKM Ac-2983]|uniref:helix-turn-helix domain-containing protein n=1 Tax=Modestobacter sp. VKM Ac-2983 TaxID=3004137 RepID=UPI0022ABC33A|nr:helix-turn-helix transcriptional regulator [Modestobacter sp. VKM Ac-2983]MCZ2804331.1 helix-turn-helix transcriptional regulator [Modestobacter sp. VKM Ac-2983]